MRIDDWSRSQIDQRFADFAEKHIASRAAVLRKSATVPENLWTLMQAEGLFGLGLPEPFGGRGYGAAALISAGRAMVEAGGNLGIAMSWLIHEMTARYLILAHGNPEQHRLWLPDLAAGRKTACFAVSEPGVGAHPKLLKTSAEKDGDQFVLHGAKTHVSNGPMADLFVVVAITGTDGGRNRFSAFLVSREIPGLRVGEPMAIDFLRPAPHAAISLDGCRMHEQQMLGPAGSAWKPMVLGFREVEDCLMSGLLIGGLSFLLYRLRDMAGMVEASKEAIFEAHVELCGLWEIAKNAVRMLDTGESPGGRSDLALYFRKHAGELLQDIGRIAEQTGTNSEAGFASMASDLSAALRIGGSTLSARKQKRHAQWFERN